MQFLVLAYDGDDAEAPARRRTARPGHLEGIKPLVQNRQIRAAGAILNDAGVPIGSAVLADFPTREALDTWIKSDPYTAQNVWQRIEVKPFKFAVIDGQITP